MHRVREIVGGRGTPSQQARLWPRLPGERAFRGCLADSVDHYGAVSGAAPEELPPVVMRRVAGHAGIHNAWLAEH